VVRAEERGKVSFSFSGLLSFSGLYAEREKRKRLTLFPSLSKLQKKIFLS
jgi:hypothetical protein